VSALPEPTDDLDGRVAAAIAAARRPAWLLDAAELLAEPDPGPTPWLVEGLIVSQAIVAFVGRWKTTKSYALLYLLMCVALGEPAWGLPTDGGPVVYVCEESGRAALWRRLDSLARGYALDPEQLRGQLYVAANARVRLDDPGFQAELTAIGRDIRPRAFGFDPLARMKAATREENAQKDMAPVIEYLRDLRDETQAAVGFVHHTGHAGENMRGSSDLESVWESRLAWKRNGQDPFVEIQAEHREAETPSPLRYRISWDHDTRTMRFPLVADATGPTLEQRIVAYVTATPKQKAREIAQGVDTRATDVDRVLAELVAAGTLHKGRSGRLDKLGREIQDDVYTLPETLNPDLRDVSSQPLFPDDPRDETHLPRPTPDEPGRATPANPHHNTDGASSHNGTNQDETHAEHRGSVPRPTPLRGDEADETPDEPPNEPQESDDGIPF
jgi:hypothetical protein